MPCTGAEAATDPHWYPHPMHAKKPGLAGGTSLETQLLRKLRPEDSKFMTNLTRPSFEINGLSKTD